MDPRTALKHYLKIQIKHHMDLEKVTAEERSLTIEELLSKSTFSTLGEIRAEAAIDELMASHPEATAYYRDVFAEAHAEAIADRE
jgi:hypothetical protein